MKPWVVNAGGSGNKDFLSVRFIRVEPRKTGFVEI